MRGISNKIKLFKLCTIHEIDHFNQEVSTHTRRSFKKIQTDVESITISTVKGQNDMKTSEKMNFSTEKVC